MSRQGGQKRQNTGRAYSERPCGLQIQVSAPVSNTTDSCRRRRAGQMSPRWVKIAQHMIPRGCAATLSLESVALRSRQAVENWVCLVPTTRSRRRRELRGHPALDIVKIQRLELLIKLAAASCSRSSGCVCSTEGSANSKRAPPGTNTRRRRARMPWAISAAATSSGVSLPSGRRGLLAPIFDLQPLPGADTLENAGLSSTRFRGRSAPQVK
jgi:hypothetical protein